MKNTVCNVMKSMYFQYFNIHCYFYKEMIPHKKNYINIKYKYKSIVR